MLAKASCRPGLPWLQGATWGEGVTVILLHMFVWVILKVLGRNLLRYGCGNVSLVAAWRRGEHLGEPVSLQIPPPPSSPRPRAGETSLRCAQDGPGPRTSPPPGRLFWPLCEWKAPTGDSVQPSSFSVSPPCPHTPGSRKHMFAQNLGLRRRSTGSGPGGLGLRLHLPVARVTWGLLLCPLSGTWIWARL